ncbi:hypothetical protein GCM10009555_017740 [Acrocarpospora macrocephala]|uniref:Uncharacterized protein n=1 Tax=Acrocarpospora macrocephala TaxID=150177 RepID=A0A5M3WEN1_9ACTN|nr:hypothetical protein [Acrocarpospora macrocephala]GES07434.1 hypothetical protein Amac_010290 [Acrocarpospora macrocephala]
MSATDDILAGINAATRDIMDDGRDTWIAELLKNAPTWRELIDEGMCTEEQVKAKFPDAITGKIVPGQIIADGAEVTVQVLNERGELEEVRGRWEIRP